MLPEIHLLVPVNEFLMFLKHFYRQNQQEGYIVFLCNLQTDLVFLVAAALGECCEHVDLLHPRHWDVIIQGATLINNTAGMCNQGLRWPVILSKVSQNSNWLSFQG